MQNVCDSQMGNTERFTLMSAFTSQGDLFVLCAKRPLQLLSFCYFWHEGQLLQQLQSPPPPCSAHIRQRGSLISASEKKNKSLLRRKWGHRIPGVSLRNTADGSQEAMGKMKKKDSDSIQGYAWLAKYVHVGYSCPLEKTTFFVSKNEGQLSI